MSNFIIVNQNVKLRNGGRKAPKMSVSDFKEAVGNKLGLDVDFSDPYSIMSALFETDSGNKFFLDAGKITVDFENVGSPEEYSQMPQGVVYEDEKICQTSSGVPFVPLSFGGDWENPVIGFMYWDGKCIRGYIPMYGNCINRKTKEAFGNDYDEDEKFLRSEGVTEPMDDVWKKLTYDYSLCLQDFENRLETL